MLGEGGGGGGGIMTARERWHKILLYRSFTCILQFIYELI